MIDEFCTSLAAQWWEALPPARRNRGEYEVILRGLCASYGTDATDALVDAGWARLPAWQKADDA